METRKSLFGLLLGVALLLPLFSVAALAQELPRAETVWHSSDWGPPKGFNPLLPSVDWGVNVANGPSLGIFNDYGVGRHIYV